MAKIQIPSENTLVDDSRRILPHWLSVFKSIITRINSVEAAIPEASGSILDYSRSAGQGEIPVFDKGWKGIPPGESGSILTMGEDGLPGYTTLSGGRNLLSTQDAASGALLFGPFSDEYREYLIEFDDFTTLGASGFTDLEVSADGTFPSPLRVRWAGSRSVNSLSTPQSFISGASQAACIAIAISPAVNVAGSLRILKRPSSRNFSEIEMTIWGFSPDIAQQYMEFKHARMVTINGVFSYIKIAPSAGTGSFSAGKFYLYGIN